MVFNSRSGNFSLSEKILIGLIVLANLLRISVAIKTHFVSSDALQFVTLGYNLFHSGQFVSDYGVVPAWVQSPLFPVIIGLFTTFLPKISAGFVLAEICIILTIFLIYKFSLKLHTRQTALAAVLLFSVNPVTIYVYGRLISEVLFIPLNFLIFFLLFYSYKKKSFFSLINIFYISLLSVLLYLTRIEGLFFIAFIFIFMIKSVGLKKAVIFIMFFVILLLPYGFTVKASSGQFSVIPKITYNARLGIVTTQRDYPTTSDNQDDNKIQEYAWYAYDPEIKALFSENIMDDSYYSKIESSVFDKSSADDIVFSLSQRILLNSSRTISVLLKSYAFPLLFFIAIVMGVFFMFRYNKTFLIIAGMWNIVSFYFIISHVEYRFFYTMLPFFPIIAALGITSVFSQKSKKAVFLLCMIVLILINSMYYIYGYFQEQQKRERFYKLSQIAHKDVSPGQKICVRMPHIAFWGDYQYMKLPLCSRDNLVEYMDLNEIDFLFLGNEVFNTRSEFEPIFEEKDKHFKLIESYNFPEETFKIFKKYE